MKKLLSILLTLTMITTVALTFGSCGEKPEDADNGGSSSGTGSVSSEEQRDPYDIVKPGIDKLQTITSAHIKTKSDMTIEIVSMGMETSTTQTGEVKYKKDGDKTILNTVTTAEAAGTKTTTKLYFDGKYCYTEMLGEKIKMEWPEAMLNSQVNSFKAINFEKSDVTNSEKTKDGDNTVVTLQLSQTVFDKYFKENMGMSDLGIDEEMQKSMSVTTSDAKITYTVNTSGDIIKMKIDMKVAIKVDIQGQQMEMNFNKLITEQEYVAVNTPVEITPPADLDQYVGAEN